MTREEKIRAIEDIKGGVPPKFALLSQPVFLYRNKGETNWRTEETKEGLIVSEDDRIKYLPTAICIENVSVQFKYKW